MKEPKGVSATDGLFLYIGAAIPTTGPVPKPRYVFGTSVSAASAEGGPQEGATNQEDERAQGSECNRRAFPIYRGCDPDNGAGP